MNFSDCEDENWGKTLTRKKGERTKQPAYPYNLLSFLDLDYMIDGVTRVDGLPGRPGRVALSTIVYVLRWGNLPR